MDEELIIDPFEHEPTQKALELGLFEVKISYYTDGKNIRHEKRDLMVTPKGQIYFTKKLTKTK